MSLPTIQDSTIQMVITFVHVTAITVDEVTNISIKPVTTAEGMVTAAIIMRRDITTDQNTPGRAAIDITGIAAVVIMEADPLGEVTVADNNNEIFQEKSFVDVFRTGEIGCSDIFFLVLCA